MIPIIILLTLNVAYTYPKLITHNEGKVIEIKSNYYIIKSRNQKFVLYSNEHLNFDDQIKFDRNFKLVESVNRKYGFNFQKYLLRNNIKYELVSDEVIVSKKSKSLRANLFDLILKHDNKDYLLKVFFNINSDNIDSNMNDFILSSGVIIKSLIYFLVLILNKFHSERKTFIFEICLIMFGLFLFKQYAFYLYLLISKIINQSTLASLDKICMPAIIILIINPTYMYSLSFIITTLYRLAAFIQNNRNPITLNLTVITPLQLILFYEVSLIEVLMFPLKRVVGVIAFILATVDILIKSNLSYTFMNKFSLNSNYLSFSGHMNLIVLSLWIIVTLKIYQKVKVSNIILITSLLFINQNQLMFKPTLTYNQLYVGQGDAAIITYPFKNEVLIIDTGSSYNESKLADFLNYYGVRVVNGLIVSHLDEDHAGNIAFLKENYTVREMILEPIDYSFYNLKINLQKYESDDDNDASLITYFKVNNTTYLSLGDVSKNIENKFINDFENLNANVIKIAHHGSDSSTSEKLLENSHIKLLINSSGKNNMYNHPHPSVIKRIDEYNHILVDTQTVGDITIKHFFQFDYIIY